MLSTAVSWWAHHRIRLLLPAIFLAPVLYFFLASPRPTSSFFALPVSRYTPRPNLLHHVLLDSSRKLQILRIGFPAGSIRRWERGSYGHSGGWRSGGRAGGGGRQCRVRPCVLPDSGSGYRICLSCVELVMIGFCSCSPSAAPPTRNGYIRIDCYGGLNQLRRDVC